MSTPPDKPDPHAAGFLWLEEGELRRGLLADVCVPAPPDLTLSYVVPEHLVDRLRPGQRVRVPVGRRDRPAVGFCAAVSQREWTASLKTIMDIVDPIPLLDRTLLELGSWMARYYAAPLYLTLTAMVPEPVKSLAGYRRLRLIRPAADADRTGLSPKQRAVLEALEAAGGPMEWHALLRQCQCTDAVLRAMLARRALVVETQMRPAPIEEPRDELHEPTFELNSDQRRAIEAINVLLERRAFRVNLLHGVSGSGKTEVYVRAVRRALELGRQAIILVPEIALTTQTLGRLVRRFHHVAVIHSGLTGRQRSLAWSAIAAGQIRVVVGTRSAIFAPCPDLGLIVVDEEQEPSFKNQQAPRYHARDVAVKRGQLASVPVLLGSATPSLETWLNTEHLPHYRRLSLPHRVAGLPLPAVQLVDMRAEHKARRGFHLLSRLMEQKLAETLDRGEQAVLLLNRRGYASYLFCPSCLQVMTCPNCSVNLVLHKPQELALCHHCHTHVPVPKRCPTAGCGHFLVFFGMGTQRVEEEIGRKFPQARLARVDSDTMKHPRQYREVIERFERRDIDLLLGTQMIAKGLDFPFVSFVGVVSADTALAIPDFRSAERTFQLITQVAGRAGRAGTGGEVVVQSFAHDVAAIRTAVHQRFELFARHELPIRRDLNLPPYWRLTRLVVSDAVDSRARAAAEDLAERIRRHLQGAPTAPVPTPGAAPAGTVPQVLCIGPERCVLERLKNRYRYDVTLRAPTADGMQKLLDALRAERIFYSRAARLTVDVDPVSLM